MRALITGHKGFIGRHLWDRDLWAAHGFDDVRGVDTRLGEDCREFFRKDASRFDVVIHCAALVDGREAIEHKAALLGAYNLQLDGALFEWALKAKPGRIVYFSSSAAYPTSLQNGQYIGTALKESHCGNGTPDASYGWVKLTGERIAAEVRKAGIPVTVVRPFSGYGEDQDDCYPFPAMIARAKRHDDPFDVWGDGTQVRDWIHVDDIVAAIFALIDQQVDGPVNLGTGIGTSMDDLARLCMAQAGYEAPIRHLTGKPAGVMHRVCDPSLMRQFYEPKISLEEGIARALEAPTRIHVG